MENIRVCFIGGGNMARSLVGGLIADGVAAARLCVADPSHTQRQALVTLCGVETYAANNDAARGADVIVLAVKPQDLREVALDLADTVSAHAPLVISIAAGIREQDLRRWLGDTAIVRAMPNTPALLGCGVSALYANEHATEPQREIAESILRAVGSVVWLDDENLMDAVTAVSGTGPAYFFLFMEIIAETAATVGLPDDVARLLTVETALGAARMALETSEDLDTLRQRVTSPGGTTAAAMATLNSPVLRELIDGAVRRARDRSAELATEFGRDS